MFFHRLYCNFFYMKIKMWKAKLKNTLRSYYYISLSCWKLLLNFILSWKICSHNCKIFSTVHYHSEYFSIMSTYIRINIHKSYFFNCRKYPIKNLQLNKGSNFCIFIMNLLSILSLSHPKKIIKFYVPFIDLMTQIINDNYHTKS